MEEKQFVINNATLELIMEYLISRPFKEVAMIIRQIELNAKEYNSEIMEKTNE
jgi:hypothetical protein